jgi:hypothetical protein
MLFLIINNEIIHRFWDSVYDAVPFKIAISDTYIASAIFFNSTVQYKITATPMSYRFCYVIFLDI